MGEIKFPISKRPRTRGGRTLCTCIEPDPGAVDRLREELHAKGVYGRASVDRLDADGALPYTENLVNVVFLGQGTVGRVPLQEVSRVLCPGGVLFAPIEGIRAAELAAAGLEPLPPSRREGAVWRGAKSLGQATWTSGRTPATPPTATRYRRMRRLLRRGAVRWLAGPPQEISNIVTGGGRAFFAGVIARDGFNGLRLWERTLNPSPARGGFYFDVVEGGVQPVAAAKLAGAILPTHLLPAVPSASVR